HLRTSKHFKLEINMLKKIVAVLSVVVRWLSVLFYCFAIPAHLLVICVVCCAVCVPDFHILWSSSVYFGSPGFEQALLVCDSGYRFVLLIKFHTRYYIIIAERRILIIQFIK
ncbi:hypothetical protein L9F63_011946, partial [Diploptera punctata]